MALNNVGFAEFFVQSIGAVSGNVDWDVVLVSLFANVFIVVVAVKGMHWVSRLNFVFFLLIAAGVLAFFAGTLLRPAGFFAGYTGYDSSEFSRNWSPHFTARTDFYAVLGVFFPAVSGVLQGVEVSGELKNPARDIPLGTFVGIGYTTFVYVVLLFLCAATATAEALQDVDSRNYIVVVSAVAPLVSAAVVAASLSTSLSMLVGAPRVLASALEDNIVPSLRCLTRVNSRGDPLNGYVLTTVAASVITMATKGKLDTIAMMVTNLFMLEYAIINYSCWFAASNKAVGWRPLFTFFNKYHALLGTVSCVALMFIVDWPSAIIFCAVAFLVFQYVKARKPMSRDFGEASSAVAFYSAVRAVRDVESHGYENVKNYRPSFLLLANFAPDLPDMRLLLSQFYKAYGLVVQVGWASIPCFVALFDLILFLFLLLLLLFLLLLLLLLLLRLLPHLDLFVGVHACVLTYMYRCVYAFVQIMFACLHACMHECMCACVCRARSYRARSTTRAWTTCTPCPRRR